MQHGCKHRIVCQEICTSYAPVGGFYGLPYKHRPHITKIFCQIKRRERCFLAPSSFPDKDTIICTAHRLDCEEFAVRCRIRDFMRFHGLVWFAKPPRCCIDIQIYDVFLYMVTFLQIFFKKFSPVSPTA